MGSRFAAQGGAAFIRKLSPNDNKNGHKALPRSGSAAAIPIAVAAAGRMCREVQNWVDNKLL